ncbi:hypothetical protein Sjap_000633 [Stephania japonica]|uniref:Fe2OG dioxygenase domain-containing protein n=1 Tax=Stephania japonica TaxID=461633 RepID=A0AAP0KK13_9MAGN
MTAEYDRAQEVKAFDDTKGGVKGLVEAGITRVPRIFVTPPDMVNERMSSSGRSKVVVNHGIPVEILMAVRTFHEQPKEERSEFYSRDISRKVRYNCNFDLYNSKAANWRDTVGCIVAPEALNQQELPVAFRNILMDYSKHAMKLGIGLFELLSEALRLNPSHLHNMGCLEGHLVLGHYYPPCPEPDKTLGFSKHSDNDFLTILFQDQIGGLQVLHHGEWIDILPIHGGLVVNIGDLLQASPFVAIPNLIVLFQ